MGEVEDILRSKVGLVFTQDDVDEIMRCLEPPEVMVFPCNIPYHIQIAIEDTYASYR